MNDNTRTTQPPKVSLMFSKTIKHQHLKFSVAVRLSLERILIQVQ